jgi:hypothetical protein
MGEVIRWLDGPAESAHAVVRAAMAHLQVVSVHPFGDGNGRISRIVQSLVLALDRLLAPEFVTIEEYSTRTRPPTTPPFGRFREGPTSASATRCPSCAFALRDTSRRRAAGCASWPKLGRAGHSSSTSSASDAGPTGW